MRTYERNNSADTKVSEEGGAGGAPGVLPLRRKEWQTTCDELTATPIPHPPCATQREKVEKIGSKYEQRMKGGVGEGVLRFNFYFSLLLSHLTGNKLN